MITDNMEVYKKTFMDVVELFCENSCTTFEYIKANNLQFHEKKSVCGACKVNELKKWIAMTSKFRNTEFAIALSEMLNQNIINAMTIVEDIKKSQMPKVGG